MCALHRPVPLPSQRRGAAEGGLRALGPEGGDWLDVPDCVEGKDEAVVQLQGCCKMVVGHSRAARTGSGEGSHFGTASAQAAVAVAVAAPEETAGALGLGTPRPPGSS